MKEDFTGFIIVETSTVVNATHAAECLQHWCTTLGVPSVLASDTTSYFQIQVLREQADG